MGSPMYFEAWFHYIALFFFSLPLFMLKAGAYGARFQHII